MIEFPRDGPTSDGGVTRNSPFDFTLPVNGTYRIAFSASAGQSTQFAIELDGSVVPWSVTGRSSNDSLISGEAIVDASTLNDSSFNIINAGGSFIQVTPQAGGANAVAAYVIVERLR